MSVKYLFLILGITAWLNVTAQYDQINKWNITVGGGLAFPLPKYGSIDLERSLLFLDYNNDGEIDYLFFEFFDKQDHGAANLGHFITGSISRLFLGHFVFSINYDYTENSVDTKKINTYYNNTIKAYYNSSIIDTYNYIFSQDPYRVKSIYMGIGYTFIKSHWNLTLQPLGGKAIMTYPIYDLAVPPTIYHAEHRGATPDLKSFTYGFSVALRASPFKNILVAVHSKFMGADFEYMIEPESTGLDSFVRNDEVNYRIIDLGLSIGLVF